MSQQGSVVVIGGTSGLGLEVARHYADSGRRVYLTGRDGARAAGVAAEVGGDTTGLGVDLGEPATIGEALSEVSGVVDRLVIAAILRDNNTVREFDIAGAMQLVTMKLVGYAEVIHTLGGRMSDDTSILLFGGLAKERPYPGSTTVTTVNGGVTSMIRTLALELAPIRVNAIHPAIVGDTPFWADKPEAVLDAFRARTPTGRLVTTADVVHAAVFLLENASMNGHNLFVDGGWLLT
jgi:NAD(P)-dependent dehydrogenase (short-subunit alcohol dehydrogenase family)